MKLLPKSEVSKAHAIAERQKADEGLKLARRIDALRETASDEEAALKKFRTESISQIHADISTESQKLSELKTEVSALEKQKREARKPLDFEWSEVKRNKRETEELQSQVRKHLEMAQSERKDAKEALRSAVNMEARASTKDSIALSALQEAERSRVETQTALTEAQELREKAQKDKEASERELIQRYTECAVRERGIEMREETLNTKLKEVRAMERKLIDRRETLQRTIKRLENQYGRRIEG